MTIDLPKEFQKYFDGTEIKFDELYRLLLAIDLYLMEKVSLNKAAELCELNIHDFIDELKLRKIRRLTGYETVKDVEDEQKEFVKFSKV